MKIYSTIFILFCFFTSFSQNKEYEPYGKLRVDINNIIHQSSLKKTNGERLTYLQNEIKKIENKFSKESSEYAYLKKYYLDFYCRVFDPLNSCFTNINTEYVGEREELYFLTKKIYGDKSILYADEIGYYVMNFTSSCSKPLSTKISKELLNLLDRAIEIFQNSNTLDTNEINIYIPIYLGAKANIFYKIGLRDSSLRYYNKAINYKLTHLAFDEYFPALIKLYSQILNQSKGESDEGLNFVKKYQPLIKENYKKYPKIYFNYLCGLLDLAIISNRINIGNIKYLTEAEEICKNEFGESSSIYLNFILSKKLQAYKNLGWKSEVFSLLKKVEIDIIENNPKVLTINNFRDYYLEWFKYYKSINKEEEGLEYLYWIQNFETNKDINRSEIIFRRSVLDELFSYYQNRNSDSSISYLFKALDLEIKSKAQFGNYVIHEYDQIAKYYIGFNDINLAKKGLEYCDSALNEYENAYGTNSEFYKVALYNKGIAEYIINNKKKGVEKMYAFVYGQLEDTNFVPTYNKSIFQAYAKILENNREYDSSDIFLNEIYIRNPFKDIFGVLGMSQSLQNKSLNELYNQNYFILNQHLNRSLQNEYDYTLKSLAENLFKKNLIFKLQKEERDVISNYSANDSLIKTIKKSKELYDSLIFNRSKNAYQIDSLYSVYESNKSWALENFKLGKANPLEKPGSLYDSVTKYLNKKECLLDIVRFVSDEESIKKVHYALLILDKSTNQKIKYQFIKEGDLIENYVKKNKLKELNQLLLPLITSLKDYEKIFINPDGIFNLINLYSLKGTDNKYLIESKTIQYINSLEAIKPENKQNNKSKTHTAVFFGDPSFSTTNSFSENRGTFFDGYNFSALRELPYTRAEIKEAMDVLNSKGWVTQSFLKNNCSEDKFSQNTNYDIIHIATHGFYYDDTSIIKSNEVDNNNPYLRSGLIFGLKEKNFKKNLDNILTAHEVFDYDLHNTSLVVLSACESAKGESNPGQGIYGIQRAFKVAGAKNVLVSTKQVKDKVTKMLMSYFYNHVANGEDYVNAFRNAQLEMIKNPLIDDVNYWNGFILIGE